MWVLTLCTVSLDSNANPQTEKTRLDTLAKQYVSSILSAENYSFSVSILVTFMFLFSSYCYSYY